MWLKVRVRGEAGSRLGVPLSLRVKDDHAAHPADHAVVAGLLHFFEVDSCDPTTLPFQQIPKITIGILDKKL